MTSITTHSPSLKNLADDLYARRPQFARVTEPFATPVGNCAAELKDIFEDIALRAPERKSFCGLPMGDDDKTANLRQDMRIEILARISETAALAHRMTDEEMDRNFCYLVGILQDILLAMKAVDPQLPDNCLPINVKTTIEGCMRHVIFLRSDKAVMHINDVGNCLCGETSSR
jgi:hypothetical protein